MDDVDIIRFPQILTREQHAERISELQEEFENPHISEDPKKRLQNAIVYVQERKWSQRKAAKKAGVSQPAVFRYACVVTLFFFVFLPLSLFLDYILSFCRAMKALKEGRIPGESRHRQLLTNEELQEVREEIDRRTLRLDAPNPMQRSRRCSWRNLRREDVITHMPERLLISRSAMLHSTSTSKLWALQHM